MRTSTKVLLGVVAALGLAVFGALAFAGAWFAARPQYLTLQLQSEPLTDVVVHGDMAEWMVTAASTKWRRLRPQHARKLNPRADVWLVRPELDAHFAVFTLKADPGGGWIVQKAMAAELEAAVEGSPSHEILASAPYDTALEDGWLAHYRVEKRDLKLEHLYAGFAQNEHLFLVQGWAKRSDFPALEAELRAMIASFTVPLTPFDVAQNGLTRRMYALPGFRDRLMEEGVEPGAWGKQLAEDGLKRLDVETLERRTALLRRMTSNAELADCVAFSRGTASIANIQSALSRLGPEHAEAWMDFTFSAMEASYLDKPRVRLSEDDATRARLELIPPQHPEMQRVVAILQDPAASEEDVCWAERRMLDRLFELPTDARRRVLPLLQQ